MATEIWFYHLQSQPLERALPALVAKARERGWHVCIQTVDDLRLKVLDDLLWTYSPESFLPHGTGRDKDAARQPVLVIDDQGNPNAATCRFYVDGAEVDAGGAGGYERIILLFDGRNEVELEAARRQWTRLKTNGMSLAYWRQSDAGRWERQA